MSFLSMRSKITFLILVISGFFLACKKDHTTTPQSDVNLKKGLLVYLPFDGNMADSSGNGNQTTAVGGATLTYDEHGYSNSAFGGTGNGERLLVTNNGSIKFDTAYTLSYNIMTRTTGYQTFVSMVNNINGRGPTFTSGINAPFSNVLQWATVDSTSSCPSDGGTSSVINTSTFMPQPESWYNFILVFHKGINQIYVNGALVATKTGSITKAFICPDAQLVIGGWWQNDPITINGKLDEVRLYNRTLNADEMAELSKDFQAN